jgi:hypothetical protein
MSVCAGYVYCAVCHRTKAPLGRSMPLAMAGGHWCYDDCVGYRIDPQPECRWPGEESCGPGCTRSGK